LAAANMTASDVILTLASGHDYHTIHIFLLNRRCHIHLNVPPSIPQTFISYLTQLHTQPRTLFRYSRFAVTYFAKLSVGSKQHP